MVLKKERELKFTFRHLEMYAKTVFVRYIPFTMVL